MGRERNSSGIRPDSIICLETYTEIKTLKLKATLRLKETPQVSSRILLAQKMLRYEKISSGATKLQKRGD